MEIYNRFRKRHWNSFRLTGCFYVLHPAAVFIYLFIFLLLTFLFNHPLFIFTCFLFALLQSIYFVGFKPTIYGLRSYGSFALFFVLVTPFFNHRGSHILFYFFDKPMTLESLAYGVYMMTLLSTTLIIFIVINAALPSSKILYLFSRVAPQTAFILNMTIRFTDILKRKATDYIGIQKTRGQKKSIKYFARLLCSFASWMLEDSMVASDTLRAKEYGKHKRTHYKEYFFTVKDSLLILICMALFVGIFFLKIQDAGLFNYFRGFFDLSFNKITQAAYLLLVIYLILPFCFRLY